MIIMIIAKQPSGSSWKGNARQQKGEEDSTAGFMFCFVPNDGFVKGNTERTPTLHTKAAH